jgi:hypothetical protein
MHTLKKLAAAVTIVMAAGGAQAAITDGLTQSGELFFNVWDETAQQSYGLDLGITTTELLANPNQTLTFNLFSDANYGSFLSPQSPLVFNIAGFDAVLNDISDVPFYGDMLTSNAAVASMVAGAGWSTAQLDGLNSRFSVHLGALNSVESNPTANGAGNGSGVAGPGNGDAYYGANTWMNNFGGGIPFTNSAGVDTALSFWHLGTTDGADVVTTQFDNVWTLSSNGVLTYAPSVSQVPVPAAVWLFGTGLMGLVGVARRKTAAAV